MPFYFAGRSYLTPTIVSSINESALADTAVALSDNLAIIADCPHGQPGVVMEFASPSDAAAVLVSGEALTAVQRAFDPSAETGGPSTVYFVRVGQATQSTGTLLDANAVVAMNLATTDYGIQSVGAQIKVQAGTSKGRKITVKQNGVTYTGDNLYLAPLSIKYTGVGSTPRVQVNVGDVTLRVSGNVVATLPFTQYSTVQALVDAINAVPDFAAVVGTGQGSATTAALFDITTNVDVTNSVDLTAINTAVAAWINSAQEPTIMNATMVYGAGAIAVGTTFTVLTGGTSPAVSNQDWSNAFDLLQTADVQWIVPLSSAASIHAMASAHVDFMSTVGRAERRALCGMALATADSAAIAEALTLNDDRVSLIHLGVYDFDQSGNLTLYPPYILAAQAAGALAGLPPGTALTNKTMKCQGFERLLKNPTDTDNLIAGGVMPFHKSRRGFVCTMSISTWLANTNINRVQINTGTALDYTVRALRDSLEDEVGKNGGPLLLGEVLSRIDTVLKQLATPNPIGPGVLVGDDTSPAYKGFTATITLDAIIVQGQVSPVIATNYIGIVVNAVPYSGTASASSSN